MSEVLFEVKEENLDTGMRGYPVGHCVTSSADPQKGLSYVGVPITQLASEEPEKAIYLLMHGREGSKSEIEAFSRDLVQRSGLSNEVVDSIRHLPRSGHPMKLFESALLIAGMVEGKEDYQEDCLNIIAKIPEIAAQVITYHAGWKMNASNPSLGYMENFAHMLNVPQADEQALSEILKVFNVLHYDHGGGNLSTFIGKGVASGLEEMYGSLAAAMCGLEGPRHGRANQDCLQFVKEVLEQVGENATEEDVEQLIRKRLSNHQLVFGFGHAVLRVEDPRATVFYAMAEERFSANPLVKIASLLRKAGPKVLKENPKISNPYPNVDAVSGTLLSAAGFPYPEYYTVLFGLSRCVGISIQILYERCQAREGKGLPIIRPKYLYKPRS